MKKIFLSIAAFVAAAPLVLASGAAFASTDYTPVLVKQFDTNSDDNFAVNSIVPVDESVAVVYLENGELWLTDGTADGTDPLTESAYDAGLDSWSFKFQIEKPEVVANRDGIVYFWGFVLSDNTWNVWSFDGTNFDQITTAGFENYGAMYWLNDEIYTWARSSTTLLTGTSLYQIKPSTGAVDEIAGGNGCGEHSEASMTTYLNGKIIFSSETATSCEFDLLAWDPSSPATAPVSLGAATGAGLNFAAFESRAVFEGEFYFSGNHVDNGEELWATDGTVAGTRFVKDIIAGNEGSRPGVDSRMWFTEFNGELYFPANNSDIGDYQLYKTDGTTDGTVRVLDTPLEPGDCSEAPGVVLDGKLFTDFDCNMSVFDGTNVTTLSNSGDMCYSWCAAPLAFDGNVFYIDYVDNENALWVTDGTVEGTVKVTDFDSSTPMGDYSDVTGVQLGSRLLFGVTDQVDDGGAGEMSLYAIEAQNAGLAETGSTVDGLALAGLFTVVAGAGVYAVRRRTRA